MVCREIGEVHIDLAAAAATVAVVAAAAEEKKSSFLCICKLVRRPKYDDNVTIDAFHVCSETNDINKKIKLLRIFRGR